MRNESVKNVRVTLRLSDTNRVLSSFEGFTDNSFPSAHFVGYFPSFVLGLLGLCDSLCDSLELSICVDESLWMFCGCNVCVCVCVLFYKDGKNHPQSSGTNPVATINFPFLEIIMQFCSREITQL